MYCFERAREHPMKAEVDQSTPTADLPLVGTVVAEGGRSRYFGQNDKTTLLNQARGLITICET